MRLKADKGTPEPSLSYHFLEIVNPIHDWPDCAACETSDVITAIQQRSCAPGTGKQCCGSLSRFIWYRLHPDAWSQIERCRQLEQSRIPGSQSLRRNVTFQSAKTKVRDSQLLFYL